jgi:hypothetical protein
MLIRGSNGSVFHVVAAETEDGRYFVCLCGVLVQKECLSQQSVADGAYSRCWTCRKLKNEAILQSRADALRMSRYREPVTEPRRRPVPVPTQKGGADAPDQD